MKSVLKRYIREFLNEEKNSRLGIEKDRWYNLQDDISDPEIDQLIKNDIVDIVNKSYSSMGGHPWIKKPEDLDWYNDINFIDNDHDPEIDASIIGNEGPHGVKMGASASDGSAKSKKAQIDKLVELSEEGGYWAEVSGAPAHILLKRGLNAISDKEKVEELIGSNINWYGECPVDHPSFHGNVPTTFKNVRGWYERQIGSDKHMKFIVGSP